MLNREGAIVMSSAISVKSSPDSDATDLFVLHEGTKVVISSEVDGWAEITIADGKKGWTELSHLERI
jgi:SH3-like domain-containing protein